MGDTPVDIGLFWENDKEEEGKVEEDGLSFIRRWCWYWSWWWLCGCTDDDNKDNNYDNNYEDNIFYYNIRISEWIIKESINWRRQGWWWWWWWEGRVLGRRHAGMRRRHALGWGDNDKYKRISARQQQPYHIEDYQWWRRRRRQQQQQQQQGKHLIGTDRLY